MAHITPRDESGKRLTPTPLKKRQTRVITRPTFPSTYAVVKPARVTEIGIRTSPPSHTARRRSSGTHTPLRFSFACLTTRSERRPAIGAPTVHVSRIGHRAGPKGRTKVANPVWEEQETNQTFACNSVFFTLGPGQREIDISLSRTYNGICDRYR